MAGIKTLADIPTLTQLYRSSSLRRAPPPPPPPAAAFAPPSAAINARVGLVRGDITTLRLDAIVNAANTSLLGGGGVDGAIHSAAGPDLLAECRRVGGCPTGHARITHGYRLPARHVIHTVGPVYDAADAPRCERLLRACYDASLALAAASGVRTLAFSAIGTGLYGYPSRDAARVACDAVRRHLDGDGGTLQRVVFVTFDHKDVAAYDEMLPKFFPPAE